MAHKNVIIGYPDEALIEELRQTAELVGKPVLTGNDFKKISGISACIVSQRFGGWQKALERAGLAHMFSGEPENLASLYRKYSDEDLLEEMRRVAGLVDKPWLSQEDFKRHSTMCNNTTINARFGCWANALDRASLPTRENLYRKSDETLLEELRRVARLLDKPTLSTVDFNMHSGMASATLSKRFHGWQNALVRAGLANMSCREPENAARWRRKYSDEDLLKELRRVAAIVGKHVLSTSDFKRYSSMGSGNIQDRFGSWRNALERAGLAHMYAGSEENRRKYSDEEMLEDLRRVAAIVGKQVLSSCAFEKHLKIGSSLIGHRFGGWRDALGLAGLVRPGEPISYRKYSDEDLLHELRRVAALLDKAPLTTANFGVYSRISPRIIGLRFDGWRNALTQAGLAHMSSGEPEYRTHQNYKYSDEELLEELQRVAALIDDPGVSSRDFRKHSEISVGTISSRFGGWHAARQRAGLRP